MSAIESSFQSGFFDMRREDQSTAAETNRLTNAETHSQSHQDTPNDLDVQNDTNHSSLSTASQKYYDSLNAERAIRRSVAISTMQLGGGIETAMFLASLINNGEQPLVNEVEVEVASGVKG